MSASFDISASTCSYSVSVGTSATDYIKSSKGNAIIVADEFFSDTLDALGCEFIKITACEDSKNLGEIPALIEQLRMKGASRSTSLLAMGGGVVQDITGFVASIYMRGVPWTYMPTTLLGMADSCIGGKSSINVGPYKNIVGTFHPPSKVLIDPTLIGTLNYEMRVAGLCEIAKITYCRGPEVFDAFLKLDVDPMSETAKFSSAIELSLQAKKWFIEVDEFDRAERLLLNFGHTFGHAIESASSFRISHGIAVGLGMLAALDASLRNGMPATSSPRAVALADKVRKWLAGMPGLEAEIAAMDEDKLITAFLSDKKHSQDKFSIIVPTQNDGIERWQLPKTDETIAVVRSAFASLRP